LFLLQGFAKVPRTALVKATHGVFHTNPELVYQSSPNVHLVASPSKHAARVVGLGSPHKHNGVAGASGMLDDVPTKLASFQEFVPHLHDASEHSTSQVCTTKSLLAYLMTLLGLPSPGLCTAPSAWHLTIC
jgi:hypothetical protein